MDGPTRCARSTHPTRRQVKELEAAHNAELREMMAAQEVELDEIREQAAAGHQGAQLALDVFRQRLLQLIGAMAASLRGVDVLALTRGIGEHDAALKAELVEALAWLPNLEIAIVPADEEGMIARLCQRSAAVG